MSKVPVCADCEHLMSYLYRKRCTKFCCGHKAINNEISNNNHSIGAIIYALPEYVDRPTVKTSPKWCPLRSGGKNIVKINGIEQLPGQLDMFGGIVNIEVSAYEESRNDQEYGQTPRDSGSA